MAPGVAQLGFTAAQGLMNAMGTFGVPGSLTSQGVPVGIGSSVMGIPTSFVTMGFNGELAPISANIGSSVAGLAPGQAAEHGPQGGHNANDPNAPPGVFGADPAAAPPGPSGEPAGVGPSAGSASEGQYHRGGSVRDRQPGLAETITAQEDEFVVKTTIAMTRDISPRP